MSAVVIGMDPHKRSATIEVMDSDEAVLGGGRYGTDVPGYRAMRRAVRWLRCCPQWSVQDVSGHGVSADCGTGTPGRARRRDPAKSSPRHHQRARQARRLQIQPLAAAGFRVAAPDMRGYNLSSKPDGFVGSHLLIANGARESCAASRFKESSTL
jgi:hypothetical protein